MNRITKCLFAAGFPIFLGMLPTFVHADDSEVDLKPGTSMRLEANVLTLVRCAATEANPNPIAEKCDLVSTPQQNSYILIRVLRGTNVLFHKSVYQTDSSKVYTEALTIMSELQKLGACPQ